MNSICVFGDSTSWGAWDSENGGWVNRLWLSLVDHEPYITLYNLSIDGGTSETILARFEQEARAREAHVLIFQTGGNDASYLGAGGTTRVPVEQFKNNIEEIIVRAKKITSHIIFMDLKNCDETKTMPVSWADIHYTNESIMRYVHVMREVCQRNNVFFLELPELTNDEFEDGLHPNAIGHEKIFQTVKGFLEGQKLI